MNKFIWWIVTYRIHLIVEIHIYLLLFIFIFLVVSITNTGTIYISISISRSGSGSGTLWKKLLFGNRNKWFNILAVLLLNFVTFASVLLLFFMADNEWPLLCVMSLSCWPTLSLLLLSCYVSSWLVLNDLWFVSGGQPDLRVLVTRRSEVGSRRQQVSLRNTEKWMNENYTTVLWEHWFFERTITRNVL
jgi:hypothetical protein